MGDFAADTLRDSIESGWDLTGNLSKTAADNMKEVVRFFAHPQIPGKELTKTVSVRKINTAELENETEFPEYSETQDRFEITCRRRIRDTGETSYDQAEADIEDMTEKVRSIVKTVYSPSAGTGAFNRASWQWSKSDTFESGEPELIRTLTLTLFQMKSKNTEVFRGYKSLLAFDMSASTNMDDAPAGDYTYTEAFDVTTDEGSESITVMTRNSSAKTGKPARFRGMFTGVFRARMYAKKSDLNGTTAEKLDNIYKAQTNGEHIEAVLLDSAPNTEGTPVTLTNSTPIHVTRMGRHTADENLIEYTLTGNITTPTTTSVA